MPEENNLPIISEGNKLPMVSRAKALMPSNLVQAIKLAEFMSQATTLPKHLRENPGNCLSVIMLADRIGMDPFQVASKSYQTKADAPLAFESQLIAAAVNASGLLDGRLKISWDGEGKSRTCTVVGRIKGEDEDRVKTSPKIDEIKVKNSPVWATDPDQQLAYYTQRSWARLYVPEATMGMMAPEEIQEFDGGTIENKAPLTKAMLEQQAAPEVETVEADDEPTSEEKPAPEVTDEPKWREPCLTLLRNVENVGGKDALASCDEEFAKLQIEYPDMSDTAFNAIDEALNAARKRLDNPEQDQK